MKPVLIILLLLLTVQANSQVIINEFQSSNDMTIADEWGDYDDWIELYNPSNEDVNIEGLVLRNGGHVWGIPTGDASTLLHPGDYFLIWADHEEEEGIFHANFRLSTSESLILCEEDSSTVIQSLTVPDIPTDASYGICGEGAWSILENPTPEEANDCTSDVYEAFSSRLISVYPTNANKEIRIEIPEQFNENISMKMITSSGLVIKEITNINKDQTVNLESLNSGIYIIKVSGAGNLSFTQKICLF